MQNGTYLMPLPFVWKGETLVFKGAVHKRSEVCDAAKFAGIFLDWIIIGKCQIIKQYLVIIKNVTKPWRLVLNPGKSL